MKTGFRVLILLGITLLLSTLVVSSVPAQPPEPPEVLENGEFPLKLDEVNYALVQREAQMSIDGENEINATETWWSTSGTTFTPASSSITYNYAGFGCVDTGGAGDFWRGSVNLPHGSTIIGMWFNYWNEINDPSNSTIYLRRYKYDGAFQDIIQIGGDETGEGSKMKFSFNLSTINLVDNSNYAYVLVWSGIPTQNLCGVNLIYNPPSFFAVALPLVEK